jgi:hypothetical protein
MEMLVHKGCEALQYSGRNLYLSFCVNKNKVRKVPVHKNDDGNLLKES